MINNTAQKEKSTKRMELVNILQLCIAGTMIVQLTLLGFFTDISLAVFWIMPAYLLCTTFYTLSAFHVSPFKKNNKNIVVKILKFICIILLLLIAWGISWLIQVLNSHYYDSIFLHISFAIIIIFSSTVFLLEILSIENKNLQGEKNE